MVNKTNGGKTIKSYKYIQKIVEENKNLYIYEIPIIMKAFKKTLLYFIKNAIEFSIKDFFDFKKILKKEAKIYLRYRDELGTIPEHYIMKMKTSVNLKDYLNNRNDFKESKHREYLPDGEIRNKKIG